MRPIFYFFLQNNKFSYQKTLKNKYFFETFIYEVLTKRVEVI